MLKITKVIKTIEFQTNIVKMMTILEILAILTKMIKNHRDPCKKHENHEIIRIPLVNFQNNENM